MGNSEPVWSKGLGLEAQRTQVMGFIGGQAQLVRKFIEVESGKRNSRPKLLEALAYAKQNKARLAIPLLSWIDSAVMLALSVVAFSQWLYK